MTICGVRRSSIVSCIMHLRYKNKLYCDDGPAIVFDKNCPLISSAHLRFFISLKTEVYVVLN